MSLHIWRGPEEDVGCACTVRNFTIEKIEGKEGARRAEGTITGVDYVEHGFKFTEKWTAIEIVKGWEAKKFQDPNEKFAFVDKKTEEQVFTMNSEINEGMVRFIQKHLAEFTANGKAVAEPEKYTGPMRIYTGPCRCNELRASNPANPFPWQKLTEGKFPKNCFLCSCSEMWWRPDEKREQWVPVKDPKAQEMLLTYNGVAVQPLGSLGDGLLLLQTIRDRGYIPVG